MQFNVANKEVLELSTNSSPNHINQIIVFKICLLSQRVVVFTSLKLFCRSIKLALEKETTETNPCTGIFRSLLTIKIKN